MFCIYISICYICYIYVIYIYVIYICYIYICYIYMLCIYICYMYMNMYNIYMYIHGFTPLIFWSECNDFWMYCLLAMKKHIQQFLGTTIS